MKQTVSNSLSYIYIHNLDLSVCMYYLHDNNAKQISTNAVLKYQNIAYIHSVCNTLFCNISEHL